MRLASRNTSYPEGNAPDMTSHDLRSYKVEGESPPGGSSSTFPAAQGWANGDGPRNSMPPFFCADAITRSKSATPDAGCSAVIGSLASI